MMRLTTALLTLGVGTAIATTAIAQPGWWVGCNPEADLCRLLSGGADPQLGPGYVAPTYPRSMYMYVPTTQHPHAQNRREQSLLDETKKNPKPGYARLGLLEVYCSKLGF